MIDLLHIVGNTLRLVQKLLGALDRGLQLLERRIWQARKIPRLVDQHLRLILQRGDLIVDLLQRASGRKYVLRIIVWIEHHDLRRRWRCCEADCKRGDTHRRETTDNVHDFSPSAGETGMMSAAQARPRCFSHAATKPSRPCSPRISAIAVWSDLAEAAVKASAMSPRLAVVVPLRRRAGEDLDLAVVQAEATVDRRDLRLDCALVRQEQPGRTALNDSGRDRGAVDIR